MFSSVYGSVPYPEPMPVWNGENNQYYSVFFDEEGEAYVVGKIHLGQLSKDLDTLVIEIPADKVRMINAVQGYFGEKRKCTRMEAHPSWGIEPRCMSWNHNRRQMYDLANYTTQQYSGVTVVTFALPKKIKAGEEMSLLFSYKAMGYVEKGYHVYEYSLETPRIGYDFTQVRVAVNVQPNLVLEGGESQVNYRANYGLFEVGAAKPSAEVMASQVEDFSRRIEYQQGVVDVAYVLDPHESFIVEGRYSDSAFYLNIESYFAAGFLFLLLGGLFIGGMRMVYSRKKNGLALFSGLGASGCIILSWIGLFALAVLEPFSYQTRELMWFLLVLLEIVWMLALGIGVPLYVGMEKGAKQGLAAFASIVAGIFVFLCALVVVVTIIGLGQGGVIY